MSKEIPREIGTLHGHRDTSPRAQDAFERRAREQDKTTGDDMLNEIRDFMPIIKKNIRDLNRHLERLKTFVDIFEDKKDKFPKNKEILESIGQDILYKGGPTRTFQEVEGAYAEGRNLGIILNGYHHSRNGFHAMHKGIESGIQTIEANIRIVENLDFYKPGDAEMQDIKKFQEEYSSTLKEKVREFQDHSKGKHSTLSNLEASSIPVSELNDIRIWLNNPNRQFS